MPATKKCQSLDHNTPPKDPTKQNKQKKKPKPTQANCPVHENAIVEEDEERDIAGDDALICESKCNARIHRTCLGLNKQNYQALSESDTPYLCPHCMLNKQAQEIDEF